MEQIRRRELQRHKRHSSVLHSFNSCYSWSTMPWPFDWPAARGCLQKSFCLPESCESTYCIATDSARPAFDFDEEEALPGQNQQIHLIAGTVARLELKVRLCTVRIMIWQTSSNKVEATPLMLVLRGSNDVQTGCFHRLPHKWPSPLLRRRGWRIWFSRFLWCETCVLFRDALRTRLHLSQ